MHLVKYKSQNCTNFIKICMLLRMKINVIQLYESKNCMGFHLDKATIICIKSYFY